MNISAELFERITGVPPIEPRDFGHFGGGPDEQRPTARIWTGQRARLSVRAGASAGSAEAVRVREMSTTGASVTCTRRLAPGREFTLTIPCELGAAGEVARIGCVVVHCERGGTGGCSYVIGARFVSAGSSPGWLPEPAGVQAAGPKPPATITGI